MCGLRFAENVNVVAVMYLVRFDSERSSCVFTRRILSLAHGPSEFIRFVKAHINATSGYG